jgi:hypothetical protein
MTSMKWIITIVMLGLTRERGRCRRDRLRQHHLAYLG